MAAGFAITSSAIAQEQYVPILSYRVGPYAAGGSGFFGGSDDNSGHGGGDDD